MGDRTLVATLSSDLDVPGNKARAATLRIRSYDDQGKALDEPATKAKDPTLLTNRALAVGGVAIAGGRGNLWGAFAGLLLLACVSPALTHLHIEAYWEKAIQGAIILLAVVADGWRRRRGGG